MTLVAALTRGLAPFGLNLIGTTTVAAYDGLVPSTHRFAGDPAAVRSIVVIGNGGGAFWSAYRAHLARHPEHAERMHPLDDYTTTIVAETVLPLVRGLGLRATVRLPFEDTPRPLSFVHLAEAAGLGRRSLLGVLVHPEYGPWMALRAAVLVDADADPRAARPAAGFDPCPSCVERPCVGACPGSAIVSPDGWNVPRCVAFRVEAAEGNPCRDRCHARVACVYGRRHRYPDDALAYHQHRAFTAGC